MEKLISNQRTDENMDVETSQGDNLSLDIMDTSDRISPSRKQTEPDMAASASSDHSSPVNVMLSYLIKCYDRVTKEEKTMSKVLYVYSFIGLSELYNILTESCGKDYVMRFWHKIN